MAEGLFNARAPAGWRAGSAGTDPGQQVRPEAVAVMREAGIDISRQVPKSIAAAMAPDVEVVVGLCAEEACPVIPGTRMLHWPLPNPAGTVSVLAFVEITRGSRNKYEFDPAHGGIRLDRVLYSPLHYPADYGIIRETLAEDGDPLDVLIFTYEPTFPGCLVDVRPACSTCEMRRVPTTRSWLCPWATRASRASPN
jgi:protein-tyrosine-phosphatase